MGSPRANWGCSGEVRTLGEAPWLETSNSHLTNALAVLYTLGGTAVPGLDYVAPPATIAIPAGAAFVDVPIVPVDDTLVEEPETVTLTLLPHPGTAVPPPPEAYVLGLATTATATITSEDLPPPPAVTITSPTNGTHLTDLAASPISIPISFSAVDLDGFITSYAIFDGARWLASNTIAFVTPPAPGVAPNPGVFTITRDGPTNLPLDVTYAITSPPRPIRLTSAFVLAQNGVDYAAISGVATIPAGATSTDIVIAPVYDLFAEVSEIVHLTLRPSTILLPDPSSYMLGDATTASLIIRDAAVPAGTPVVRITANDSQAYEDNVFSRTASFVVERNASLTDSLTVLYSISGTARNGVDYVTLPGSVTIPAGSPRTLIVVTPIADGLAEPAESVGLTLQPPPLDVYPPPYLVGTSSTMPRSAGVSIRDHLVFPPNRYTRLLQRLRNRHVIVPLPVPELVAAAAASWMIEVSADLTTWEEIGTATSSDEAGEFVDVSEADSPSRFYRFRAVPPPAP